MIERLHLQNYIPSLYVAPSNAATAALAAIGTFAIMKIVLALSRRKLCQLSEEQAQHTWAEILKKTLASTSTLAIIATALLVGLAVLDLPAPWNERVKHLWFVGLGAQVALYLHRALGIAAVHYFRRHGTRDQSETVAHTLVVWALQT
jgi:hypothetical protein